MKIGKFYKPAEVAELIGCSRKKIYRMIEEGQLPGVRFGRLLRVPEEDLHELLETEKEQARSTQQTRNLLRCADR